MYDKRVEILHRRLTELLFTLKLLIHRLTNIIEY